MADNFDWNEHAIARLRELWADPANSTAGIGRILGCGKNAVVGKAGRLDLPRRPSPIVLGHPGPRKPQQVSRHVRMEAAKLPGLASVPTPPPVVHDDANPHRDASLANGGIRARVIKVEDAPRPVFKPMASRPCCWPIGEPRTPTFRYCDANAVPGKPYCESHCQVAYVPIRDRRDDGAGATR